MKRSVIAICLFILVWLIPLRSFSDKLIGNVDSSLEVERVTITNDGKLYSWNKEGRYLPTWPKDLSSQNRRFAYLPRLVDLDLDQQDEIITVSEGTDGGSLKLHVFKGDGSELTSWHHALSDDDIIETPIIFDVNHDSSPEIIYSTKGDKNVSVFRRDFSRIAAFSRGFDSLPRLAVGDPDNDGLVNLYASVGGNIYAWDNTGTASAIYALPSGEEIIGGIEFADINNDSYTEFIFSTTNGRILGVDQHGSMLMEIHVPSGVGIASGVILADLDCDKRFEMVIVTDKRNIIAYKPTGEIVSSLSYKLDYRQPFLTAGLVANDIYQGLFSSVTGFDQNVIYRTNHNSYSKIKLGENVREWDAFANFDFLELVDIFDLFAFPKPFTPNSDGVNDTTTINYNISDDAVVALDLYDSHENFIARIKDKELQKAGAHTATWLGVNNKGTTTINDDVALGTGIYYIKVIAESKDGFVSSAKTSVIINGVKAEIETPKDENKQDSIYPKVFGKVSISGIAIDPNFGEDNLDADFNSYKLYYKPGIWTLSDDEVTKTGEAGSSWIPIEVQLMNQCPNNDHNEAIDTAYPHSNVSCRPVQHGVLGTFDASNSELTPNGEYTILLKVLDSNGNTSGKVNFDTLVVSVANPSLGDPFDPNNPYDINNPNNPIYDGPKLLNTSLSNSALTKQNPSTTIGYTLENETSDIYITIYAVEGTSAGSAVAVYSLKNQSPNAYSFAWNGTNTLGRNVSGGNYKINISAYAVDGTGVDSTDSLTLSVANGYSASDTLNLESDPATGSEIFNVTPNHFNPIDFGTDLKAEKAFITYKLSKEAKVSVQILEESGDGSLIVKKTISSDEIKIRDNGNEFWDGTGDNGVVLPIDKNYIVRLTAQGIDIGNTEIIYRDLPVRLDSSTVNENIVADIAQLIGDQGEVVNKGEDLKAIVGNPDFLWRASATGYVQMPFSYTISASGSEKYNEYASGTQSDKVIICERACIGGSGIGCGDSEKPVVNIGVNLESGFAITKYSISYDNDHGGSANVTNTSFTSGNLNLSMPPNFVEYSKPFSSSLKNNRSVNFSAYTTTPTGSAELLERCPIAPYDEWLSLCSRCVTEGGDSFCNVGPGGGTWVYDCGTVTVFAEGEKTLTRSWPISGTWPSISGNVIIVSNGTNPRNNFAVYNGPIGSGAADAFDAVVAQYGLAVSNMVNGVTSTASSNGATITLPGLRASLNSSGYISASVPLTSYSTISNDPYLQNAPYKKIWGSYNDFNDDYYNRYTDKIYFYKNGYKANIFNGNPSTNLYSFSNVVHITGWNVDVRYPNVTVSKPDGDSPLNTVFALESPVVTPAGVVGNQNTNINDYFRLKLLPEATPKKFVEIKGSAGANYELYYYDNSDIDPQWHSIEPRTHNPVTAGTLAHWDVTNLNGENYTIALKTYSGNQLNVDTFNVGIGTVVDTTGIDSNDFERVYSPFKRAALIFGKDSILDGSALVTINSIDKSSAAFTIPTAVVPLGPIFEIKPDDIQINPQHHVQLEITYTKDELQSSFGVADPSVLTIYNLAGDDVLEGLATVITFDDMDDSDPTNDVYRFTASLEHFSQYLLAKKIAGYFSIESPKPDKSANGSINIIGRVESSPRPSEQVDEPQPLASLTNLDIYYYPENDPQSKVQIYSVSNAAATTNLSTIDTTWDVHELNGNYVLRFDATGPQGALSSHEIHIAVDNAPSQSILIVNGKVVPNGETDYIATGSVLEITASDSLSEDWQSGVQLIEYSLDGSEYVNYEQPINLYLSSGSHTINYHAIDNNGNAEDDRSATLIIQEKMSDVQSDDISLHLNVVGPKYTYNGQTWINNDTSFEITANSGNFDHISYRATDSEYAVYGNPFSIQSDEEGVYVIEYFAVDQLGLRGVINSLPVLLDVTPPITSISVSGLSQEFGSDLIISPDTTISLKSVDGGDSPSGISRIEYKINDGVWQIYSEPIKFKTSSILSYRGVDNISNGEEPHTVNVSIDSVKPNLSVVNISKVISPNGDGRYDQAELIVNVSDNIYDKLYLDMTLQSQDGTLYNVFSDKELITGRNKLTWDGRINGELLPEAVYNNEIILKDAGGNVSNSYLGLLAYDVTPPVVEVLNGSVRSISPNGDNASDVLQVQYSVNDNIFNKDIQVTLQILSGGEYEILKNTENVEIPPNEHVISWNGTNAMQNGAFDGNYDFQIIAEDMAGNRSNPQDGSALSVGDVFVDRYYPQTTLEVDGVSYYDDDEKLWLGADSLLRLKAIDPMPSSGVQDVFYAFNANPWMGFVQPIVLPQEDIDYSFNYKSKDVVGNEEPVKSRMVRLDKAPPVSDVDIGNPKETDSSYNLYISPKTPISLFAKDENGVGVNNIYIEVEGARISSQYVSPITLAGLGDGSYNLIYSSDDRLGNKENDNKYKVVLDATPPVTEIIVGEPKTTDIDSGVTYVTSDTIMSFNAVANRDDLSITEYKVDSDDWMIASPFNLAKEGEYTISFRSFDRLENEETTKTKTIIVDNTPPESKLELNQNSGGSVNFVTSNTLITISGLDAASKVASIEYNVDGGEYKKYTGPFSLANLSVGTHVINYRVKDKLGNISTSQIYTVQLIDVSVKREINKIPRVLVFMLQTQDIRADDAKPNEDLLRDIQNDIGGYVTIINGDHSDPATIDKFIAEMRTDKYSTFIFATDAYTVNFYNTDKVVNMLSEIKARIYKGDSLILMTGYSDIDDASWVDFISEYSPSDVSNFSDYFGKNDVGLIWYEYGYGKIANFGSDLGRLAADNNSDYLAIVTGLMDVIRETLPNNEEFDSGEVTDITETFENSGDTEVKISVSELFPAGWIETKTTVGEVPIVSRKFDLVIPANSSVNVDYLYRPQVDIGEYEFSSDINATWSDGLVSTVNMLAPYVVKNNLMSRLESLIANVDEAGVADRLLMVQRRIMLSAETIATNDDFNEMIEIVLAAIEQTKSADTKLQLCEIVESLGALQSTMNLNADVSVGLGDPNDPSSYHGETSSGLGSGGGCQLANVSDFDLSAAFMMLCSIASICFVRRKGYGKQ